MDKVNRILDRLLFKTYWTSNESLGIYRIIYALLILLVYHVPQFRRLGDLPGVYFKPQPGVARLFSGFPSYEVLFVMDIVILISLICILIGYKTRWASITYGLLVMIGIALVSSTGKTSHNGVLNWMIPVFLSGAWGCAYSVDSLKSSCHKKGSSWPIAFLALILGFGYFTAGIQKLYGGWLGIKTAHFHGLLMRHIYVKDEGGPLLEFATTMPQFAAEIMDWTVVLFEIGFLVAIFWPVIFRGLTIIALAFHLSVLLIMGINFSVAWIFYLLFWAHCFKIREFSWSRKHSVVALLLIVGYLVLFYTVRQPSLTFYLKKMGVSSDAISIWIMVILLVLGCWQYYLELRKLYIARKEAK